MGKLAQAFVDPLGAFDAPGSRDRRSRRAGDLRKDLEELDRWLSGRALASEQSMLAGLDLAGRLVVVEGPAGSGKTTVLARHAARMIHALGAEGGPEQGGPPMVLITARTASASAQLRARVLTAYRRWSTATKLPRWVDTMELPEAIERIRSRARKGGRQGYRWLLVDEAQELDATWWNWMLRHGLERSAGTSGILACADPGQRLHDAPPPIATIARETGLDYRIEALPTTYRTPHQVIEPAFNLLHGTLSTAYRAPQGRRDERLALLRTCHASEALDGWLNIHFAARGSGIAGSPTGAAPRVVRALDARSAAEAAVRDAVALVDEHGASHADVVIVSVDPRATRAVTRAAIGMGLAGRFTRRAKDPSKPPPALIRILGIAECRGHDFPIALIVGIERLPGTAAERTLLYQAATRAQHLMIAYGVGGMGLSDEFSACIERSESRR